MLVNVISTLIQRRFVNVDSPIKFNVETTLILVASKNNFFLISWSWKIKIFILTYLYNLYITVFQRRNNVCLATVNQPQKSMLLSYNRMLEKSKSLYNIEMITVFQRRNNVSLSLLNQRRNLKLKQCWQRSYVLFKFRWANNRRHFNGHFGFNVFDVFLKEKKIVVALSLIDKFSIF